MITIPDTFLGTYTGEGRWRDDKGESHPYHVRLTLAARDGGLGVTFHHAFYEEPNVPDVSADLTMLPVSAGILRFEMGPIRGRGHYGDRHLHYTIPLPGNAVEVTHFFDGQTCHVAGSAEKNSAGNYIMWSEVLTRVT